MASIDYIAIKATVDGIISDFGRTITVERYSKTPSNSSEPWNGTTDPQGTAEATASVAAIAVPPSGVNELGLHTADADLLKRSKTIFIVQPTASFDLATANQVIDEGVTKKVVFVETLRPQTTTLLYYIGVEQ